MPESITNYFPLSSLLLVKLLSVLVNECCLVGALGVLFQALVDESCHIRSVHAAHAFLLCGRRLSRTQHGLWVLLLHVKDLHFHWRSHERAVHLLL
jgi:hypothetical protein